MNTSAAALLTKIQRVQAVVELRERLLTTEEGRLCGQQLAESERALTSELRASRRCRLGKTSLCLLLLQTCCFCRAAAAALTLTLTTSTIPQRNPNHTCSPAQPASLAAAALRRSSWTTRS